MHAFQFHMFFYHNIMCCTVLIAYIYWVLSARQNSCTTFAMAVGQTKYYLSNWNSSTSWAQRTQILFWIKTNNNHIIGFVCGAHEQIFHKCHAPYRFYLFHPSEMFEFDFEVDDLFRTESHRSIYVCLA